MLQPQKYAIHPPAPELSPYILYYATFEHNDTVNHWVSPLANGFPEILIHFGDKLKVTDNKNLNTAFNKAAFLGGQIKKNGVYLKTTGIVKSISITINPYALNHFTDVPAWEMNNSATNLELLYGYSAKLLMEQILESDSPKDQVDIINRFFISKIKKKKTDPVIIHAIEHIHKYKGFTVISKLSKNLDVTIRTLQRKFKEQIGLSPKEYARIIRFNSIFHLIRNKTVYSIEEIISSCNFYDHSHLINEFKYFAGFSPYKVLKHRNDYLLDTNRFFLITDHLIKKE
jgi:AraC-like DNA-binding protein